MLGWHETLDKFTCKPINVGQDPVEKKKKRQKKETEETPTGGNQTFNYV